MIEALVALLVMAFGMVALVGLLSNMRRSADLARQRGDAIRWAESQMENMRDFSRLVLDNPAPAGQQAYSDIQQINGQVSNNATQNTVFTLTQTVGPPNTSALKGINIKVSWTDRAQGAQFVDIAGFIAGADPGLSGSLGIAPDVSPQRRAPNGKSVIPFSSKDLGGGQSAIKPQPDGTVVLVMNSLTGMVTGICTVSSSLALATLTKADLTSACMNNLATANGGSGYAYLLNGFVRFSTVASPATPDSSQPSSPALPLVMSLSTTGSGYPATPVCYSDSPIVSNAFQTAVQYICLVYPNAAATPAWSGRLNVIGMGSGYQVCRYSTYADDAVSPPNAGHPRDYTTVTGSLVNQNFLVILASQSCPAGDTTHPATVLMPAS